MAGQKLVPELTPTMGGKMRLPAPKNMEKSMREATTTVIAPGALGDPEETGEAMELRILSRLEYLSTTQQSSDPQY